jgi:hypothetical protein
LLAHGRWFSPVAPASSITKTGRHDIAEILLKVALNTKNKKIKSISTYHQWFNSYQNLFWICSVTDLYLVVSITT